MTTHHHAAAPFRSPGSPRPTGIAGRVFGSVAGLSFLAVWAVGWTAFTIGFDFLWARDLYRQIRAEGFPTVTGTVLSSAVRTTKGSDGDSHRADVRYRYVVDDRPYESQTVRHGTKVSGRAHAERVSRRFPPGSAVAVHYDPADPADAVLLPGVAGVDAFVPMFMLPFNAVMVGSWLAIVMWARQGMRHATGGLAVVEVGQTARVRLPRTEPWLVGGTAAAGAAVVLLFAIGVPTGFDPPLGLAAAGWGLIAAAGLFAWHRTRARDPGEAGDLLIDSTRRTLTLPVQPSAGGRFANGSRAIVRFDHVDAVTVDVTSKTDGDGDTTFKYHPTIAWRAPDGSPRTTRLADLSDRHRADALADWLARRLGVDRPAEVVTA